MLEYAVVTHHDGKGRNVKRFINLQGARQEYLHLLHLNSERKPNQMDGLTDSDHHVPPITIEVKQREVVEWETIDSVEV